jgi:hypothetical protein
MLTISKKQIQFYETPSNEIYIEELSARFKQRDPSLSQSLDKTILKQVVSKAFYAAKSIGFTQRGSIRLYLDLCITLGSGFVNDPMYPWAKAAISDGNPDTQVERAELLFQKSVVALEAISGINNEFSIRALNKISHWAHRPIEIPSSDFKKYTIDTMYSLYPEKSEFVGKDSLITLVDNAILNCNDYNIDTEKAIFLVTILKFNFGNDCLNDPLYTWIKSTLNKESGLTMETRFERLQAKAVIWLDAVIANQNG